MRTSRNVESPFFVDKKQVGLQGSLAMIRIFARQRMIVESFRQGDHEPHGAQAPSAAPQVPRSASAWTASLNRI
jgi:hypothetical protein